MRKMLLSMERDDAFLFCILHINLILGLLFLPFLFIMYVLLVSFFSYGYWITHWQDFVKEEVEEQDV